MAGYVAQLHSNALPNEELEETVEQPISWPLIIFAFLVVVTYVVCVICIIKAVLSEKNKTTVVSYISEKKSVTIETVQDTDQFFI
uniref:U91 n=1 Tax=Caenorhabditis tropicalis TaxID=1561998 RepID=A0A1I7UPM1_9PELO